MCRNAIKLDLTAAYYIDVHYDFYDTGKYCTLKFNILTQERTSFKILARSSHSGKYEYLKIYSLKNRTNFSEYYSLQLVIFIGIFEETVIGN